MLVFPFHHNPQRNLRRSSRAPPLLPDIALHTLAQGECKCMCKYMKVHVSICKNLQVNEIRVSQYPGTGPPGYNGHSSCQPLPWGGLHHDPDPQPTKLVFYSLYTLFLNHNLYDVYV